MQALAALKCSTHSNKRVQAGHVDHLLSYSKGLYIFRTMFLGKFYDYVVNLMLIQ